MIRSFSIVTTAAFLLLAGCGSPETGVSGDNTSDNSAALIDSKEDLIGTWSSPSCGDRRYERAIQFDISDNFHAQDLVSPCPPDVACIWSGIVYTEGRYLVAGEKVRLVIDSTNPGSIAKAFPEELLIDSKNNMLLEVSPQGERCPYQLDSSQ
jgi:hypothetical protein